MVLGGNTRPEELPDYKGLTCFPLAINVSSVVSPVATVWR
jgi:hypothetical protein